VEHESIRDYNQIVPDDFKTKEVQTDSVDNLLPASVDHIHLTINDAQAKAIEGSKKLLSNSKKHAEKRLKG